MELQLTVLIQVRVTQDGNRGARQQNRMEFKERELINRENSDGGKNRGVYESLLRPIYT